MYYSIYTIYNFLKISTLDDITENISHLKCSVVHRSDPSNPCTEDDGEVVDVREGGEVSVGGENFILRHDQAGLREYLY